MDVPSLARIAASLSHPRDDTVNAQAGILISLVEDLFRRVRAKHEIEAALGHHIAWPNISVDELSRASGDVVAKLLMFTGTSRLLKALNTGDFPEAECAFVDLALRFCEHGYLLGCWGGEWSRPKGLLWDSWRVDGAVGIEVSQEKGGTQVTVRREDKRVVVGTFTHPTIAADIPGWTQVETIGHCRLLDWNAPALGTTPPARFEVVRLTEAFRVKLRHAFDLIESTPYADWIRYGINTIVQVASPGNASYSCSNPRSFGVVHLSDTGDAVDLAATLIHETSHQYFHLANCLGQVGDVQATAWSPFRNEDRPLDGLLSAYHAFANVALFLEGAVPQDTERLQQVWPGLEHLDLVLWDMDLSEVGQGLFLPLREKLHLPTTPQKRRPQPAKPAKASLPSNPEQTNTSDTYLNIVDDVGGCILSDSQVTVLPSTWVEPSLLDHLRRAYPTIVVCREPEGNDKYDIGLLSIDKVPSSSFRKEVEQLKAQCARVAVYTLSDAELAAVWPEDALDLLPLRGSEKVAHL